MINYKDLSRRGLIKLNEDFDKENDDALLEYLNTTLNDYELIRPQEQRIADADEMKDAIKDTPKNIAKACKDPEIAAGVIGEAVKTIIGLF